MIPDDHLFHYNKPFQLESGESLPGFQLKYTTLGTLNADRSNVVWVCHALTGSSNVQDWWPDLFTPDGPFDPSRNFVICANVLGGCYGSTGPLSINPESGAPWYHDFPNLTVRDIVNALELLRQHLGLVSIHTLIGGSLGGQQVLEWAILKPEVFRYVIPIACNAFHSPWGIAFNEAQRMAIAADQTWAERDPRAGTEGLKAARAIGMLSYRAYETYADTQGEKDNSTLDNFRASTYQRYQGDKLASRFNAFTYWVLSKAMDSHNVGRNRESVTGALRTIQSKTLVVGIEQDVLFPVNEQKFIASHIPGTRLELIDSLYGHDGFLVECDKIKRAVAHFFKKSENKILV